jgi:UPF0176 protein
MKQVVTFYRFVRLDELETLRDRIETVCRRLGLLGTVLLAEEGLNATLVGAGRDLRVIARWLRGDERFAGMAFKFSTATSANPVFGRLKVRIKPEIVSFGRPVDAAARTGEHVDWATWNRLLADADVPVVDVRNSYEIEIGTFPEAVDPGTRSFREFPAFVAEHLDPATQPRVAMFCTGGIRCEKASAYLLEQGFEQVYQLDGGILRYLEDTAGADNRFVGECFVFDQRVSVTAELAEGGYEQCFACRRPLAPADLESARYERGVSCPACYDTTTAAQRGAFAERARQVEMNRERGESHLGSAAPAALTRGSR